MKRLRIILYIVFLAYMGITLYMGLNINKMISQFGLLSFFSFFQKWLAYGNSFFIVLLIFENINIWFLKRRLTYAEKEKEDLIIRANDLRRQIKDMKESKEQNLR